MARVVQIPVHGGALRRGRQTYVVGDGTTDKNILAAPTVTGQVLRVKAIIVCLNATTVAAATWFNLKSGASTALFEIPVMVAATTAVHVFEFGDNSPLTLDASQALVGAMQAALTAGELRAYAVGYQDVN
ncbi:MAG: hypothetical protein ACRDH5_12915 [bacterium]